MAPPTPSKPSDLDVRVISIGALDLNPLWGERVPTRSGHATTTLIRSGDRTILVDPGLPAPALVARLNERSGLTPDKVTHIFLTSFHPHTRRALAAFPEATWWISETERESVGVPLATALRDAMESDIDETADALHKDVALLQRCAPAPDEIAERVSLFPLPGVTPGMTGLIVADAQHTLVLTGDAIPTVEHLRQGQAPRQSHDIEQAQASLLEAVEIADMLILGRDNIVINPVKRPF
jgi:glyoxylase-like metal-dependent hydrolase (beta-lactamase superfamily II)